MTFVSHRNMSSNTKRDMVNITISIDGNNVAIKTDKQKRKQVITKTRVIKEKPNCIYAIMYDYDESTTLYKMTTNATEANKILNECYKYINKTLVCADAYIMAQDSLGKITKVLEAFDWDAFEKKGVDFDIDK